MRVVCVGGGPAGLYFAILMRRHGDHEVAVLERNPPGVTYGWGVVFWDDLLDELRASDPSTASAIEAASFRWVGERLAVNHAEPIDTEGGGFGIARRQLLDVLLERARALGVRVEFESDVADVGQLSEADLIVGSDGAGSRIRGLHGDRFGTEVRSGRNKYVWLGTSNVFERFTFAFVETPAGWIWCHAYGFDDRTSTFIAECAPETWAGLGFDRLEEGATLRLLEELFAAQLQGHSLRANGGVAWLEFRTLANDAWHVGNAVLIGDAAHTTHFTIGSGTKLALEDAIALASNLQDGVELEAALATYERERKLALRPAQADAEFSARWFENVPRYASLDPVQFFALLHERRSPLLPHLPPPMYYRLHQATHEIPALRRLRRWAAPKIKARSGPRRAA